MLLHDKMVKLASKKQGPFKRPCNICENFVM